MPRFIYLFCIIISLCLMAQSQPLNFPSSQKNSMKDDGRIATPFTVTDRAFSGESAGDNFGFSVSTASDVNGDAYPDIIVGAPMNDAAGTNAGRAYIFYGGPLLDATPDVILSGENAGSLFGFSIAGAGDVNGDNYPDVIVGAPGYGDTYSGRGIAYIFLGGPGMDNTYDGVMYGDFTGDSLGYSVAGIGDMNGDGNDDVVVGSPTHDQAFTVDNGAAFIYFGSDWVNDPNVIIYGAEAGCMFGYSVSGAGDVNSDGYPDVIVGSPAHEAGGTDAGRAYIYYGGRFVDNHFDVRMTGTAGARLGWSVKGAGDVNGDGFGDVLVGKGLNSLDSLQSYIYFGAKDTMDFIVDVVVSNSDGYDAFGSSLSSAGDVDGDGISDFMIGAFSSDSGGTDAGKVVLYYGGTNITYSGDAVYRGTAGDLFGTSMNSAGDLNGDGYGDLIIGAPGNDDYGTDAGKVYLKVSGTTGVVPQNVTYNGYYVDYQYSNKSLGGVVSGAGDVNGDGFDDYIIADPNENYVYVNRGKAYLYYGGPLDDYIPDVSFTGGGIRFGEQMTSGPVDVNNDGYDDVIILAAQGGNINIYFGGNPMNSTEDVILTNLISAEPDYYTWGMGLASAGDVNNDSYDDVIVGVPRNNGTPYALLYYGGNPMDNTPDKTFTGNMGTSFGFATSGAGDINNDGYDDITIGARNWSGDYQGAAFIFIGGADMDTLHDVSLSDQTTSAQFGYSVTTAGDVNGDGYDDVLIGAPYSNGNTGKAFLYYGSNSMDTFADVVMPGYSASLEFGLRVSGRGDVNGDGFADVLISGAHDFNWNAGNAIVYFGGSVMDSIPDLYLQPPANSYRFGEASAFVGDVNGDGFTDAIVGATEAGPNNVGQAYLFLMRDFSQKPSLIDVEEALGDMGGKAALHWRRCGYDVPESTRVTNYTVERSAPPASGSFNWQQVDVVTAAGGLFYSYLATTPDDDPTNESGTWYFRVTANTTNTGETWQSNIIYGRGAKYYPPRIIAGVKFEDLNSDGIHNPDEGGIYQWKIVLTPVNSADPPETTLTAANGSYIFSNLNPIIYDVSEVQRPSHIQTLPTGEGFYGLNMGSVDELYEKDFGNAPVHEYTGPSGGTWSNPTNWQDGRVPLQGDPVSVVTEIIYDVPGDNTLNTVQVGEGGTLNFHPDAGDLNIEHKFEIKNNGTITFPPENENAAMNLKGDWINKGTFNAGKSTVTFSGNSPKTIITGTDYGGLNSSGSTRRTNENAFYNLDIEGDNTSSAGNITVTNRLKLDYSIAATASDTITIENDSSAAIQSNGLIALATVKRKLRQNSTQPYRFESPKTKVQFDGNGAPQYLTMSPFPGQRPDTTFKWKVVGGTVNTDSNIITVSGVNHFSKWVFGKPGTGMRNGLKNESEYGIPKASRLYALNAEGGSVFNATIQLHYEDAEVDGDISESDLQLLRGYYYVDSVYRLWNMVSLPLDADETEKDSLFPTSITNAFSFSSSAGYTSQTNLLFGKGYWLKFSDDEVTSILGDVRTKDSLMVEEGWNLVGAVSFPVDAENVTSNPPGIISGSFFEYRNGYQVADVLKPLRAYWVKVTDNGKLILDGTNTARAKSKQGNEFLQKFNSMVFRDGSGSEQTLFFGSNKNINLKQFELPPSPPEGIFDVRFSSGRMVEVATEHEANIFPISTSSVNYPLEISWKIQNGNGVASLLTNKGETILEATGKMRIASPTSQFSLKLASVEQETPTEFALQQNYPNPFNPSTVIRYQLPVGREGFSTYNVTLKVYNILGEEVATLVDEMQVSGFRFVEWDASGLPSGVYYYRLTASSSSTTSDQVFSEVKKLLLVK